MMKREWKEKAGPFLRFAEGSNVFGRPNLQHFIPLCLAAAGVG